VRANSHQRGESLVKNGRLKPSGKRTCPYLLPAGPRMGQACGVTVDTNNHGANTVFCVLHSRREMFVT
jgi:hypothetical protein